MANLYSDEEEVTETEEVTSTDSTESEDKPTFLVPKSAFKGREVEAGDTEKIKITRVMDDQVEAVCVYGEDEEEEEETEMVSEEVEAPVGDAGMRGLME